MAWKFAQFETGRYVAEELTQVISMKEGHDNKAPSNMTLEFTPTSSKVVAIRKPVEVAFPANTEELRKGTALLRTAWQICGLKYGDRAIMADLDQIIVFGVDF